MIIDRYIRIEITRLFWGVTLILLLIFCSQQMVRYLNMVTSGKVEARIFFQLIMIEIPYLLAMLMPVGFYLAVLLGLNRLHVDHEMVILKQLGLTQTRLLGVGIQTVLPVMILLMLLMGYLNPALSDLRQRLLHQTSIAAHLVDTLASGRFQVSPDGKTVIYASQVGAQQQNHKLASQIFVAKEYDVLHSPDIQKTISAEDEWRHKKTMILIAKQAYELNTLTEKLNMGSRAFVANQGVRYWGAPTEKNMEITRFQRYQFSLPNQMAHAFNSEEETFSMRALWNQRQVPAMAAELQWRFSIPLSVLLLTLFAMQMTQVLPRQNRIWFLLFGIIVFLAYFNLLIVAKHWLEVSQVPIGVGLWWVHISFILMIVLTRIFKKR